MELDFLEAKVPLVKSYTLQSDGTLDEMPYPTVRDVTSHREIVYSPQDFYTALRNHAGQTHCLLKGTLDRPLQNESRAGHTSSGAMTSWIALDLDFDDGWNDIHSFLYSISPELARTTHIVQYSAKAGIKTGWPTLRCHVFFMLSQPVAPASLKVWLMHLNLNTPQLAARIQLSANGRSLKYPLDVTTCQNDKLLYIAPPACQGLMEPLGEDRYQLIPGEQDQATLQLDFQPPAVKAQEEKQLDEMRKALGLKATQARHKTLPNTGTRILSNPEEATVTGVKHARGFVYLNLNGGDSWGYFFPEENPTLLYNFKGEEAVYLKDIAPEFYKEYTAERRQQAEENIKPLAFREPVRDAYFNAVYDPAQDRFKLLAISGSKGKLEDFMRQYNQEPPDPVEDWTVEFNPTTTEVLSEADKWVNLYDPPDLVRHAPKVQTPVDFVPPTIHRVIFSLCGSCEDTMEHFLNWLAFIFQTRKKAETAWVFHGVPGTGKGLLQTRILKPLFGPQHVVPWTVQNFEDQFNPQLERASFLWLDEFQSNSATQAQAAMDKLKNLITEPTMQVRAMRQSAYEVTSYTNVIVATNHPDPINLDVNDRRFNVAPPQENPLLIDEDEVDQLEIEVSTFAVYLAQREVDTAAVRRVLMNEARDTMIKASQTSIEYFFAALRAGYMDYFLTFLQKGTPLDNTLYYSQYRTAVLRWAEHLYHNPEEEIFIPREEAIATYTYITGQAMAPGKFARTANIHRLVFEKSEGEYGTWIQLHIEDPDTLERWVGNQGDSHAAAQ